MRPLGVGLVFVPELFPLLRAENGAVSVVEVEPQTLWQLSRSGGHDTYRLNRERLSELAALPQRHILHSVGLPVGSTRPLDAEQIEPFRVMAESLNVSWVSEHLSFNALWDANHWTSVGFFLPPRQCVETVACAARKLRALADALNRPVAFETGVNYLRPFGDELSDGEFFRSVAEMADCGIVLDLHNLWANERNGRARTSEVLGQLPLERVWEIHFAGGMEFDGYWLDAHSGAVPEPVLELAAEWFPRMPNVGALIFEILSNHIAGLGLDGVARQLERMHWLWEQRQSKEEITIRMPSSPTGRADRPDHPNILRTWEDTLGALVIDRGCSGELASRLRTDPGLDVLRKLVVDSRASFIAQGLRYTMSLLLLSLGGAGVRDLLAEFMRRRPPELFVSAEADAFASFLEMKALRIAYLNEVLSFEHALLRAVLYEADSTVVLDHDLIALFEGLEQGRIPSDVGQRTTSLVVRPG